MPHKKLFIPGPTEVHPEVLKAWDLEMPLAAIEFDVELLQKYAWS